MAIDATPKNCPICNGEMWNNTFKKSKGEMNPKAPDYKCKDKNCTGVIWPPKDNTPRTVKEYDADREWPKKTEIINKSEKSYFNTCNAMNNATALVIGGIVPFEDIEAVYDRLLGILEK